MPPPSLTGQNNVLESLMVESSESAKNPVMLGEPSKFTCGEGLYAEAAVGVGETCSPSPPLDLQGQWIQTAGAGVGRSGGVLR